MPSPFPGMNPYFEQEDVWHDFHERFIPAAAAAIEKQVGPEYIVKIDEHMYIHEQPAEQRQFLGRSRTFHHLPGEVGLRRQRRNFAKTGGVASFTQLPCKSEFAPCAA